MFLNPKFNFVFRSVEIPRKPSKIGDDTNLEKVIHERDQLRSAIGKLAQLRQQEVESQKAFKAEIDANAEKMKGFERLQKKFDEQSNVLKKVKIFFI